MNPIIIKDYKLYKLIGKGIFGEVYLSLNINNSKLYATKRIEINKDKNEKTLKYLINEIEIMKELSHPNIIKLHNLYRTNNHYYLIMDYCNGDTLSSFLSKYKLFYGKPFSQEIIQYFMIQIVDGLKYIHSKNIIHRDLKLDNILLNFDNIEDKNNFNFLSAKIKIIDFGLSKKLSKNEITSTYAGTPYNMDPNILKNYDKDDNKLLMGCQCNKKQNEDKADDDGGNLKLQGYNQKADIWSLGTICFEMLTGEVLFKGDSLTELVEQEDQGDYSIPINFELSKEIIGFLNCMLQNNGEMRSSAEELSKHDFLVKDVKDFTNINLSQISNKIENGMLNLNIKHNSTIIEYIKNDEKCLFNSGRISKKKPEINEEEKNNINNLIYPNVKNQIINNYINSNSLKTIPFSPVKLNNKNRISKAIISPDRIRFRRNFSDELRNIEIIKPRFGEINDNNMVNLNQQPISELNQIQNMELLARNKKKMVEYINSLLKEYKNAKDYFNKNNLKKQEIEAFNKCLEIQDIKCKIESNFPINLNNIPKPITPEFIYGSSTKERNIKFKNLLNKYLNDKRVFEQKLKYNNEYETNKKANLIKLEYVIKKLMNNFNNKWVPSPNYSFETKYCQIEKISYENCNFGINFKVKKDDYIQENINLKISFIINDIKTLYKDVKLKEENNFSEEWSYILNANEWKNIDNNSDNFIIIMETDNVFDNNSKSSIRIDLRKIKTGKKISLKLSLVTMNNNKSIINFIAIPNIPEGKKYLETVKNKILIIKNFYPAFEGKILS